MARARLSAGFSYDSKSIFEDQMEHLVESSKRLGKESVDLSLLTDGLRAEREQGITIDVAYRHFSTPSRKFIIADTPGTYSVHKKYGHRGKHRRSCSNSH